MQPLDCENKDDILSFISQEARTKSYYKEVFNIEIKDVFYKRDLDKVCDKAIKSKNYLSTLKVLSFPLLIIIKDNNKKIFKYKILKGNYNSTDFRENNNMCLSHSQKIYCFVDKIVSEYCQNQYLNKMSAEYVTKIIEKNDKINYDYQNWIMENYKLSGNKMD